MESRPFKIGNGQDKDRISSLPDELLLGILERLGLREAVRASAVSRRWRHLPRQLSRLHLDVADFRGGTTVHDVMDAFTGATCRLLSACPPAECKCDGKCRRAVKTLRLRFYLSAPHLSSIGHAVEDTVTRGETQRLDFVVIPASAELIAPRKSGWRAEFGKQFMTFSRACPVAFQWLTGLSLKSLKFGNSDLPSLISACDKLKHLSLQSCRLVGHSVLKVDAPNSAIHDLEFIRFRCKRIELVSVPKLTRLLCRSWHSENPPVHFGYVPELRKVCLFSQARAGQAPFALSECFSMNARNLSKLCLRASTTQTPTSDIWIQPEHPKQLIAIFSKLTDLRLWGIFPECDLNWTLFILEAAPALQNFTLNRARHSCTKICEDSAEKTNVVWEPSEDLKHLNLKLLVMTGFEEEDKVTNFIRLVMKLAVRLRTIKLQSHTCEYCNAIDPESPITSQAEEATKYRIKELLTHGSSSSVERVEMIIC